MSELDKTITPQTDAPVEAQDSAQDSEFAAEFEKTLVSIRPGQTVTGTIVQVTDNEVCVNIGYKSDGLIPVAELINQENHREAYKVGDEIEVEVVKVNDGEGNVLLSQKNIVSRKNWDALVAKYENNEYVEGVGKDVVKGGLIVDVDGVRTFVPASQLSERYVEKIDQFVGKPMKLKIIEVDKQKRRLVASRKAVLAEESAAAKAAAWEKLEVGTIVHGIVRRLTDFGAFVDIGGVDGLIHITDLSWGRVKHPSDVVKPGDEVNVLVLALDRERERISLGLKQTKPKPWETAQVNYPVGSICEGKVVRIVTFGAFVELEPGLDGLVHISQIAPTRINKVEDVLHVGDMVVAGNAYGRIRAMVSSRGERVKHATPSTPVEIIGFGGVPEAGDEFMAVADEKLARQVVEERAAKARASMVKNSSASTLEELYSKLEQGEVKDLNIIIKADVQGSVEAVKQSLEKLSNAEVRVRTIHSGVGAITENDVMLAGIDGAIIIGFNVRPDAKARDAANRDGIDIRYYRVIYQAIEDIEKAMKGMLTPEFRENVIGHAEVRNVFKITGVGIVAGSYVTDGKLQRNAQVRLLRDNVVVYEGKLSSLQRFKDAVKEVADGYECGVCLENYTDIKEGDVIECFVMEEIPR